MLESNGGNSSANNSPETNGNNFIDLQQKNSSMLDDKRNDSSFEETKEGDEDTNREIIHEPTPEPIHTNRKEPILSSHQVNMNFKNNKQLSNCGHKIDLQRNNHFQYISPEKGGDISLAPPSSTERQEEDLLTSLIEDSILEPVQKDPTKKARKRMTMEDFPKSNQEEKRSKSKKKRKRDVGKDIDDIQAGNVAVEKSRIGLKPIDRKKNTMDYEEACDNPKKSSEAPQVPGSPRARASTELKPPRKESVNEEERKRTSKVIDVAIDVNMNSQSGPSNVVKNISVDISVDNSGAKTRDTRVSSLVRHRINSVSSVDFLMHNDVGFDRSQVRASPLTIVRASPVTVSRHNSKVTVSSTSSKAGLGALKSAKLKRLWPDSSLFRKRILKWHPPQVVIEDFKIYFKGPPKSNIDKKNLPVIPSSFRDTSEIIKCMSPHILEEGIHAVEQEFLPNSDRDGFWTREVFSMQLRVSAWTRYSTSGDF